MDMPSPILKEYRFVSPHDLEPPIWTREEGLSEEELEDILESIRERGVLEPVLVRKLDNGKFRVVAGWRRVLASRILGIEKIPVRIIDIQDEVQELLIIAEENMARKDLSTKEKVSIIKALLEKGISKTEIAKRLKISRTTLYRLLWLMEFPEELRELFYQEKLPLRASEVIKKVLEKIGEDEERKKAFIEALRASPENYEDVCEVFMREEKPEPEETQEETEEEKEEEAEEEKEEAKEEVQEDKEFEEVQQLAEKIAEKIQEDEVPSVPVETPEEEKEEVEEEEAQKEEEEEDGVIIYPAQPASPAIAEDDEEPEVDLEALRNEIIQLCDRVYPMLQALKNKIEEYKRAAGKPPFYPSQLLQLLRQILALF